VSHSQITEARDDDATLVLRVGEGDVGAYRELVMRYAPLLLRFATRLLRDEAEAEDVVQETCMRVWQHAREYTPRARVTTWIHHIAHNLAVDRLRVRGRLKPLPDEDAMPESARQPSLIDEKRRVLALDAALAELPERQAAALTLVHLHGLTGKEAAEVLGVGAEAVESLLARGRRALKQSLEAPRASGIKGAS
jgi:RNA polymerase sigma-70 factor (ECF subfamily)